MGARGKFQVWTGMFRRAAPPNLPRPTCPLKPARGNFGAPEGTGSQGGREWRQGTHQVSRAPHEGSQSPGHSTCDHGATWLLSEASLAG